MYPVLNASTGYQYSVTCTTCTVKSSFEYLSTRGFQNFDSCFRIFYTIFLAAELKFRNLQIQVAGTEYRKMASIPYNADASLITASVTSDYKIGTPIAHGLEAHSRLSRNGLRSANESCCLLLRTAEV